MYPLGEKWERNSNLFLEEQVDFPDADRDDPTNPYQYATYPPFCLMQ